MIIRCLIIIFAQLLLVTTTIATNPREILATSCQTTKHTQFNSATIAQALGWVRDSSNTLCGGHYIDPDDIINNPSPQPMQDTPLNITACNNASFAPNGISVAHGDVTLVQPGRKISADCVALFRDNHGKLRHGILVGHVRFHEYGKLILAERCQLNFVSAEHIAENGWYRLLASTPSGITNVWGQAKYAVRDAAGVLKMRQATYSTCPPDTTSWHLWSKQLTLNHNTGRGEAVNVLLFFSRFPVFYTPYFNFPLDKKRKSGFLFPDFMYSKDSGYSLALPYYFNLAPNYDATFTPIFFTKRGVLLNGLFNYLTPINVGNMAVKYIPHDSAFTTFRDNASSNNTHALALLRKSSDSRAFISWYNSAKLNANWKGSLNLNYVTDDYFLQDFSSITTAINKDQLLNQVEMNYANEHWRFSGQLQGFQTLHPITRQNVQDQYKRLPQLGLIADFPAGFGGLNYYVSSEIVNFVHSNDFVTSEPIVAGGRINVAPQISMPLSWLGAYIIPKVQLHTTGYYTHDQKNHHPNNIVRVLPTISVDSSMTFSRFVNLWQRDYSQTLEPRIFYLFVPTKNQDNIPLFDTYLPTLDFNQLFRTNRFSGIDRIGDANQFSIAVITRLLDDSGQEKLNAGIGQILNLHKHQVNIGTQDPLSSEYLSPLMGQLQYFIDPQFNAQVNTTWDPNYQHFDTANIALQYNNNGEKVVNLWYNYRKDGDIANSDLKRIGVSVGWNIWQHWNIVGNMDYNISHKYTQNYMYGLEYDSCCWTLRLLTSKTFIGVSDNSKNYETKVYLQFFLKGLGDFGLGNHDTNLANSISGYNDKRNIRL